MRYEADDHGQYCLECLELWEDCLCEDGDYEILLPELELDDEDDEDDAA